MDPMGLVRQRNSDLIFTRQGFSDPLAGLHFSLITSAGLMFRCARLVKKKAWGGHVLPSEKENMNNNLGCPPSQ